MPQAVRMYVHSRIGSILRQKQQKRAGSKECDNA